MTVTFAAKLVLNDRGRATVKANSIFTWVSLTPARANRERRAVDEQLPMGMSRRIVGKRTAIARGRDAF